MDIRTETGIWRFAAIVVIRFANGLKGANSVEEQKIMTVDEAIHRFEKQLTEAQVVLDSGFGTHDGESDVLYRHRKEMAEIALEALRKVVTYSDMEWVSTKDRLPESEDAVLVIADGKPCENITLIGAYLFAVYSQVEGWILDEYPEWDTLTVTH